MEIRLDETVLYGFSTVIMLSVGTFYMRHKRLNLLLCTGALLISQIFAACRWEHCREREDRVDESDIMEDATVELCQLLDLHAKCLKGYAKTCRGNLRYYSYVKGLSRVIEGKNCSALLSESPANGQFPTKPPRLPDTTAEALLAIPAFHGCSTMKLQDHVAYCSVFGDPHLITHDGRFQTCRIQGAYPLIENRHLAIQVSSQPVGRSSSMSTVTSISRVTIIIKSSECSDERKTYEASIDQLVPYFTDSTTESDSIKILQRIPNKFIELRILHLKIIIFIRQIGEYLSVAARLPASLLKNESAVAYQLCSAGCPLYDVLDRGEILSGQPLRSVKQAEVWCQRENLTGPFYQACLFDTAVTGDAESVVMAREAQGDWERLAPVDHRMRSWSVVRYDSVVSNNSALWPNVRWNVILLLFFAFVKLTGLIRS